MEKCKKNLTALDISALVSELKPKLVGLRLSNIFDINPKTYLLKLQKNEQKSCLIIESGVRFHTTSAKIEKSRIPSGFTMKFRKFLRSKKLESLEQIGCERVIDMKFGSDNCYHLLLEYYSQGNIILTDKDYVVLQLLRSHEFTETVKTAIGVRYPFEYAAKLYLEKFDISEAKARSLLIPETVIEEEKTIEKEKINEKDKKKQNKIVKPKKSAAPKGTKFKEILFQMLPCLNPALTEHISRELNIDANLRINENNIDIILKATEYTLNFLKDFQKKNHKGYLTESTQKNKISELKIEEEKQTDKKIENQTSFVDFAPILLLQNSDKIVKEIPSFDESLDLYFSSMEIKSEKTEFEQKAWKKFENIKQDQENRLQKLQNEQEQFLIKASLIQQNIQDVEAIISIIRTLVQSGQSWEKLTKMINDSRKSGDPLANMIYSADWEHNEVTILLSDINSDLADELLPVQINFNISGFQNADEYFTHKKKHLIKEKKTLEATQQALKLAEKTAKSEINKAKDKIDTVNARKIYWFEKFYWFISTENFLIISGRDVQQNELLVKKYLTKGDIYLHADYHGAASTIIKAATKDDIIPNNTIEEAAIAAAARSKAWENKILSSVWWVYDHQVSKSAPTGEYLPAGSFMIRGKKNFVKPTKLEMGFGLLFKIDESCLPAHAEDRKIKVLGDEISEKIENKEKSEIISEEYTVVNAGPESQPRIKNFDKNQKKPDPKKKIEENKNVKKEEKEIIAPKQEIKQESSESEEDNKNVKMENLPRGKKQKLKKIKKKYGEQDEEEKKIRMKLMGASEIKLTSTKEKNSEQNITVKKEGKEKIVEQPKKKHKKKEKKDKNIDRFAPEENLTKSMEIKKNNNESIKIHSENIIISNEIEKKSEIPIISSQEIEKKSEIPIISEEKLIKKEIFVTDLKKDEGQLENEEEKKIDIDDDSKDSEIENELEEKRFKELELEVENQTLNLEKIEWNTLIGVPLPDDVCFCIVPVCAPFPTLANYKFKVKLVPGSLKKGKAAKTLVNYFLTNECSVIERKLIRSMNDFDMINNLIGNVKMVGSGVQKILDNEKKSKKDKKFKKEKV